MYNRSSTPCALILCHSHCTTLHVQQHTICADPVPQSLHNPPCTYLGLSYCTAFRTAQHSAWFDNAVIANKQTQKWFGIAVIANKETQKWFDIAVIANKQTQKWFDIAVIANKQTQKWFDIAVVAYKQTQKWFDITVIANKQTQKAVSYRCLS